VPSLFDKLEPIDIWPHLQRRRKVSRRNLVCMVCGVTDTPEWRRGPNGDHTLCNACGLHYAKSLKKDREARQKEGQKHSIDMLLNTQTVILSALSALSAPSTTAVDTCDVFFAAVILKGNKVIHSSNTRAG